MIRQYNRIYDLAQLLASIRQLNINEVQAPVQCRESDPASPVLGKEPRDTVMQILEYGV